MQQVPLSVQNTVLSGKTTSIRGLFYLLKHTIEGTSEETFNTQDECDPVIEDIEVSLDSMREELHLYAKNAGAMVGPITVVDSGDTIDCSRMGSWRLQHPVDRRTGHCAAQKEHRQIHPACRERHGLAAIQRGQILS
jgi:DNA topoisomerase VI subunit A